MRKSSTLVAIFGAFALTGCQWSFGKPTELSENLTCTSEIVDQTVNLESGEKLYDWSTNDGEDYYGVKRQSQQQDGAVTITTIHEIKMYDHDRWVCKNDDGAYIDYKTLEPVGIN